MIRWDYYIYIIYTNLQISRKVYKNAQLKPYQNIAKYHVHTTTKALSFTVLQSVSSRYDLQKNRKKKFLIVCSHEPSVTISHFFILLHFFVLLRIEHGLRHMEERKMIANMCATIFNYILNLTSCHYNPYLD